MTFVGENGGHTLLLAIKNQSHEKRTIECSINPCYIAPACPNKINSRAAANPKQSRQIINNVSVLPGIMNSPVSDDDVVSHISMVFIFALILILIDPVSL